MPSGLTGKNFAIAIALAIGIGIVGTIIGNQIDALWLGYLGSIAAAIYLIWVYMRAQDSESGTKDQSDRGRRGR
jgi:hypothetical protein